MTFSPVQILKPREMWSLLALPENRDAKLRLPSLALRSFDICDFHIVQHGQKIIAAGAMRDDRNNGRWAVFNHLSVDGHYRRQGLATRVAFAMMASVPPDKILYVSSFTGDGQQSLMKFMPKLHLQLPELRILWHEAEDPVDGTKPYRLQIAHDGYNRDIIFESTSRTAVQNAPCALA